MDALVDTVATMGSRLPALGAVDGSAIDLLNEQWRFNMVGGDSTAGPSLYPHFEDLLARSIECPSGEKSNNSRYIGSDPWSSMMQQVTVGDDMWAAMLAGERDLQS